MKFSTFSFAENKRLTSALLILLLFVAACLRFYKIGDHGLAGDEKYSMYVSQFVVIEGGKEPNSIRNARYFTPEQFWDDVKPYHFFESIARLDTGNGAFYTLSLRLWMNVFGKSDAAARSLSAVFNLATILLLFYFVRDFFKNTSLALLVTFLSVISPFFIVFSQVARNYAMLFFFSLAATHLLLKVVEYFRSGKSIVLPGILYGICSLICLLCHISTAVLFVAHGLFILSYFRKPKLIIMLLVSALIPVIGMTLWLTSEGGKWMLEYVANSVKTYNYLAKNNPEEFLKVATPVNVFEQMQYVTSCLFISAEGLYRELIGTKNFLFALIAGIGLIVSDLFVKSTRVQLIISVCTLTGAYFLFSVNGWMFLILTGNVFLLYLLFKTTVKGNGYSELKPLQLITFIVVVGLVSLVAFAFTDGNTFRLMPRYVGYLYAFALILVAIAAYFLFQNRVINYWWILVIGCFQLVSITSLVREIYQDIAPRYFMQFYEVRNENPYYSVANTIVDKTIKSDTIVYPSFSQNLYGGKDEAAYSIADAQLINIYLPKKSEITQRIDRSEPNKVILKHADGTSEILFDFEGTKYRY
jgi:uncharacterized membrane protein